jgi:hypothetical protein
MDAKVNDPTAEEHLEYEERWEGAMVDGRPKGSQNGHVTEISPLLEDERNLSSRMSCI